VLARFDGTLVNWDATRPTSGSLWCQTATPPGGARRRSGGAGFRRAYSWAGTAPSLEANIRGIIVNRTKGAEPLPKTLAALAAYVRSLAYPENTNLKAGGSPSDAAPVAAKRGYELFLVKAGCKTCHEPPH